MMIMEGEPKQVIDTTDDPPFRYRLSVKLGPMHPGRPERLVYEPRPSWAKEKVTMFSDLLERDRKRWGTDGRAGCWALRRLSFRYRELESGERWPSLDT
jgi:hypothetical protein